MASKFARDRSLESNCFEFPVSEYFKCPICFNVLNNPKGCRNNEHYFCFACIGRHLVNSKTCPECMDELTPETLVEPPRVLVNCIQELRIKCDYSGRGCPQYVQLDQRQNHIDECGFAPTVCENEGCGEEVNRGEKVRHETEVCKFRKVSCRGCEELKSEMQELRKNQEQANKSTEEMRKEMGERQKEIDRRMAVMVERVKEGVKDILPVMASSQEEEKAKLELSTDSFDFRPHKVVFEQTLEGVITESEKAKNVLQDVTIEEGMKQEEKSPVFLASKIELMRVKAKLKCLLKQMKSLQEVEKLESQNWKMRLGVNVVKAKSVLQKKKEKKRLEALGWEMQLEEDVAKSELLIEEMELIRVVKKVESPMLEMQLKEHISKVESVLENVKKEESKTESPASRMELKELEFLLEKLKLEQEPGKLQSLPLEIELERHIVKLKLLLGETKLEKEEERQRFQLFKMELKKDIEKFLTMQIWSRYYMRLEPCLVKERSLLEKMKSLKEESTIEQLKEHTLEFESLLNNMKSVNLEAKLKFRKFEMEFHSNIVELEPILEKLKLKEEEEELRLKELVAKSEILLEEIILKPTGKGHLAKLEELIAEMNSLLRNIKVIQHNVIFVWDRTATLEALLEKMKMVQRELEFSTWGMELNKRHVKELEFVLERIELVRQKGLQSRLSRELEIELNESMESLVEMKLKQEEGRESLLLQVILEELIMKLKMLLKRTESPGSVEMLKSQVSEMQLEELLAKSRLETIKCERAKRKTELPTETRKLTPREHKEQSKLVESQSVIVIGGRGEYGESLKSVEGYIFLEGKWIELPAMNTPRSFMSSVVVDQEVIVSGGDTSDAITDSIEVLDLAETPVQWRVSPARLPVPLSAHKTVVYKGKLIVIGGHDDL